MSNSLKIPGNLLEQLAIYNLNPSDLVFYINSKCNLRCKHCYIGNALLNLSQSFLLQDSVNFINSFPKLDRITILGGEPFLYEKFDELLNSLNINKINEFRITSNLTNIKLYYNLNEKVKKKLKLSVSIDGHNPQMHDFIRGKNTFIKTIDNIKKLRSDGIDVEITHTLNNKNIDFFDDFLNLCAELQIENINIHRMSLQGNALNIKDLLVSPTRYVNFFNYLDSRNSPNGMISIRLPFLFATKEKYEELISKSEYKPHAFKSFYGKNQRIVIYPTREVFISSEFFGTESYIGKFDDELFYFNSSHKNEILYFDNNYASISDLNELQSGDDNYPYVLSVSFKKHLKI